MLMRELLTVTLIEKCSELEKKHVYSDMIERTVTMLDVGVTRLVSRLCQVTTAQLEFSPPPSMMTTLAPAQSVWPRPSTHMSWHEIGGFLRNYLLRHLQGLYLKIIISTSSH